MCTFDLLIQHQDHHYQNNLDTHSHICVLQLLYHMAFMLVLVILVFYYTIECISTNKFNL
jgi:hypothetical protein